MEGLPQNVLEIWDKQLLQNDDFINALAAYLNNLIINDFEKLIFILYKVDVDETKLKSVLNSGVNRNAGELLARMIIDRQLQKIESRKNSGTNNGDWKDV